MSSLLIKILTLPGILVGLCFHEFAHAWMSSRLGDPTPERQGRLTINPLAHIDWLGFLALLLCGFGWGKPVEIDPYYYKNRRRDELLVSVAGVIMNLLIAILFSFPTRWVGNMMMQNGSSNMLEIAYYILYFTVMINLVLMIFNLIPIPPLDGWGILTEIVDLRKYSWYPFVYQNGGYILIALIIFNVTDIVITPCVSFFMNILL